MNVSQWIHDPRPGLPYSRLWARLLALSFDEDPNGLFGALHGLRCMGAALVVTPKRIALGPGEMTEDAYQADRARYLVPHKDKLIGLLHELNRWLGSPVSMVGRRVVRGGKGGQEKASERDKASVARDPDPEHPTPAVVGGA